MELSKEDHCFGDRLGGAGEVLAKRDFIQIRLLTYRSKLHASVRRLDGYSRALSGGIAIDRRRRL